MVAIAYLSAPIAWPQYRWFMGACLTVEINTWFLILRRVVYKRGAGGGTDLARPAPTTSAAAAGDESRCPGGGGCIAALAASASRRAVSFAFYLSWIAIRCCIYPAILVVFLLMARDKISETGVFWHWPMVCIPVHFFLCVLNLKWSYDLFLPPFRRCSAFLCGGDASAAAAAAAADGPPVSAISSGL